MVMLDIKGKWLNSETCLDMAQTRSGSEALERLDLDFGWHVEEANHGLNHFLALV